MVSYKNARTVGQLVDQVKGVFASEPSLVNIPLDKPICIVGDLHGDLHRAEQVFAMYKDHTKVFLGDYVDRAPLDIEHGSLRTAVYLFEQKLEDPENVIMTRGNHEFLGIWIKESIPNEFFSYRGLASEMEHAYYPFEHTHLLQVKFDEAFQKLPLAVHAQTGLIGIHGGLPMVSNLEELAQAPKDVSQCYDNQLVLEMMWNENTHSGDPEKVNEHVHQIERGQRRSQFPSFRYGQTFFDETMKNIGKQVLVRGHTSAEKGYSLQNKVLTLHSCKQYAGEGRLTGAFVGVINDPQKELTSAKDIEIKHLSY